MQNLNPILLVRSGMADINMKVASTRDEEEKRNITRTHATPCPLLPCEAEFPFAFFFNLESKSAEYGNLNPNHDRFRS